MTRVRQPGEPWWTALYREPRRLWWVPSLFVVAASLAPRRLLADQSWAFDLAVAGTVGAVYLALSGYRYATRTWE